jgi:hypothetical protein
MFNRVVIRKPEASRDRSSELYLLGLGKRDQIPTESKMTEFENTGRAEGISLL